LRTKGNLKRCFSKGETRSKTFSKQIYTRSYHKAVNDSFLMGSMNNNCQEVIVHKDVISRQDYFILTENVEPM
jgi:hypothetical protein